MPAGLANEATPVAPRPLSTMEWTKEQVMRLIQLYRDQPALWDCRRTEYKDKNERAAALSEIVNGIGIPKDEVERKIKNLVCHFSRELKKERVSELCADSDEVYKSKWFGYNSMLFLKERSRPRTVKGVQPNPVQRRKESVKRTCFAFDEACLQVGRRQDEQPKTEPCLKDEYSLFGEQIACKLRNMDTLTRLQTQHRINSVLFEAEMSMLQGRPLSTPDLPQEEGEPPHSPEIKIESITSFDDSNRLM